MIQKVSSGVSRWLLKAGAISSEDEELYEYAAYSFLFSLAPMALVLIIGGILGMWLEGVLLILPFMLIRKFSGGYHLKSSVVCFISSTVLLALFLWVIRLVVHYEAYTIFSVIVGSSILLLSILSPIDSEERRLKEREKIVFRRVAIVMAVIIGVLYAVLMACGLFTAAVSMGSGLILAALLQLPCLVVRGRERIRQR